MRVRVSSSSFGRATYCGIPDVTKIRIIPSLSCSITPSTPLFEEDEVKSRASCPCGGKGVGFLSEASSWEIFYLCLFPRTPISPHVQHALKLEICNLIGAILTLGEQKGEAVCCTLPRFSILLS